MLKIRNSYRVWALFLSLFAGGLVSCSEKKKTPPPPPVITKKDLWEPSMKVNKKFSKEEKRLIDLYVARRKWDMLETGTGVRILRFAEGNGRPVESGAWILVEFEVELLDGSLCYSSYQTGAEQFNVDHDNVESGLHEAVKYLREGDEAVIIIPSHKAFGLMGDLSKIPPLSAVVYKLKIVRVQGEKGISVM